MTPVSLGAAIPPSSESAELRPAGLTGRAFFFEYHPSAMTAEGARQLRSMGASARPSGPREYRLSHTIPLALDARAEKRLAELCGIARIRPVHGMANKAELGHAARRMGLVLHHPSFTRC